MTDEVLFMVTLVDLGPLSAAIVACCDLTARSWLETVRPLRSLVLPEKVHGKDIKVEALACHVSVLTRGDRTQLDVDARTALGRRITAEIEIDRSARETLNVVVPFERGFAFTSKQLGFPARGVVRGKRTYEIDGLATLDHGRGTWPWRTHWNWASAADRSVAFNLGARWTDNSGTNENGVIVDGRLRSIEADMRWEFDRKHPDVPVRITGGDVDVTFTPIVRKHAPVNLGLIAADLDFRVGRFRGAIGDVAIQDLLGWCEAFDARW